MLNSLIIWGIAAGIPALCILVVVLKSVHHIGETEVGLVTKHFGKKLDGGVLAFNGEAGYQAELLMPGLRMVLWPLFSVSKHPWVQVPAGEIGVVIAQIGAPLPVGAKSAAYKPVFGEFRDAAAFIQNGGQKGVQRPVLPPGSLSPIHPVGFLVITRRAVFGVPVLEEYRRNDHLNHSTFGITEQSLLVTRIEPRASNGTAVDVCGIVTTYEGAPLPGNGVAGRIGGFDDIRQQEAANKSNAELIGAILQTKNDLHNSYQDFQAFLDKGGCIGLQHDPLLYGAYLINPFLVSVEIVPMLVVQQGEVAVIKSYVGLPTVDTSGEGFKHGSLVKPGHQGVWEETLRTGKYALNPRCYAHEIVQTKILTLNWADAVSQAHKLDEKLSQIIAKSREGFVFRIDLQVQIHVPDTRAAKVICMVGSMLNLVNEVLQAAVGNHFRDALQAMKAVEFIEKRQQVQQSAMQHISEKLKEYEIETRGVYIQDVVFPEDLVKVLTEREIATQRVDTLRKQQEAETTRIGMEAARGKADQQMSLARSEVGIVIADNEAKAKEAQARGESAFIRQTGEATADALKAKAMASAKGYEAQVTALGKEATAAVNIINALADNEVKLVPEVLVNGNGGSSGILDGMLALVTKSMVEKQGHGVPAVLPKAPEAAPTPQPAA